MRLDSSFSSNTRFRALPSTLLYKNCHDECRKWQPSLSWLIKCSWLSLEEGFFVLLQLISVQMKEWHLPCDSNSCTTFPFVKLIIDTLPAESPIKMLSAIHSRHVRDSLVKQNNDIVVKQSMSIILASKHAATLNPLWWYLSWTHSDSPFITFRMFLVLVSRLASKSHCKMSPFLQPIIITICCFWVVLMSIQLILSSTARQSISLLRLFITSSSIHFQILWRRQELLWKTVTELSSDTFLRQI